MQECRETEASCMASSNVSYFWNNFCNLLKAKHSPDTWNSYSNTSSLPKQMKGDVHMKTFIQIVLTVLFLLAKIWKQFKCPSRGEWINKMQVSLECNTNHK